jgi:hypothetical protein
MPIRVPERRKLPGVCYAVTDDGLELPVVDVTHPAFAVGCGDAELGALAEASLRDLRTWSRVPGFVVRLAARRSLLMRGTMAARGAVLDGLTTYLYKLGPENLGDGWAGPIDRKLARGIVPVSVRLRLRAVAELLANALSAALPDRPGALHLVNIGGGSAMDSLNALILARRRVPDALAGRRITIHVLDPDAAGPRFAARALAALADGDGPLAGLDVTVVHDPYDWADPLPLNSRLAAIRAEEGGHSALVGSSEGGLLEYATDAQITTNLKALRSAAVGSLVASLLQDSPLARAIQAHGRMTLRVMGLPALEALARGAGWRVEEIRDIGALYRVVTLRL